MKKYSFHKRERLCSRDHISELFENSMSFKNDMFHVFYKQKSSDIAQLPQVVISVSKKRFKRAIVRNNIKRKIREAYRLNKYIISDELNKRSLDLNFILIYIERSNSCFPTIEAKIILTLYRLKKEIEKYEL